MRSTFSSSRTSATSSVRPNSRSAKTFALGEDARAVVLSVTEGDDKPMKYPLMFKESEIALINKIDLAPYCNFDRKSAKEDIEMLHPGIVVQEVSCTTGEGIDAWCDWLKAGVAKKKK